MKLFEMSHAEVKDRSNVENNCSNTKPVLHNYTVCEAANDWLLSCTQWTAGMVRTASPSSTTATPSPPRSSSKTSLRPSTNTPLSRTSTSKHTDTQSLSFLLYSLFAIYLLYSLARTLTRSECANRSLSCFIAPLLMATDKPYSLCADLACGK